MHVTGLILPGINNSGPSHWQSLWEGSDSSLLRVNQRDWDAPVCAEWVEALDRAVTAVGPEVVLVAHSLGCLLAVHWAARRPMHIKGALLVAPPDPASSAFPSEAIGFNPLPMTTLPFRSMLVHSTDDPYCEPERALVFAKAWGSETLCVGDRGHINGQSGLGEWEVGREALRKLAAREALLEG